MDISLDIYRTFYYVCELKNITKVAELLCVTQPAITKQIKKLEELLGKSLIIRTPKGINLTNEGKLIYNEIKQPMESILCLEGSLKAKLENYDTTIKISAGHMATKKLLLPAMVSFNKQHKKVKFEMNTYPFSSGIQKLRNGELDLILYTTDELAEEYPDIATKNICEIHDVFVVSSEVRRKYPKKISILDLNNLPTISKHNPSSFRSTLDTYFKDNGQTFIPSYELSNYWLVDEYVKLGLGIAPSIKEFIADDLNSGNLVEIETDHNFPSRHMACAYRKNCASYWILKEFMKEITL